MQNKELLHISIDTNRIYCTDWDFTETKRLWRKFSDTEPTDDDIETLARKIAGLAGSDFPMPSGEAANVFESYLFSTHMEAWNKIQGLLNGVIYDFMEMAAEHILTDKKEGING